MKFYSVIEISDLLQISVQKAKSLILDGQLQGYQFGQEVRVEADDLKSYIERAKMNGNTDLIQQAINKSTTYLGACEAVERILMDSEGLTPRVAESRAVRIVMASEHGKKLFEASEVGRMNKKLQAGNPYAI